MTEKEMLEIMLNKYIFCIKQTEDTDTCECMANAIRSYLNDIGYDIIQEEGNYNIIKRIKEGE